MPPQNVLYANLRSSPSPHSSPYGAPIEYSPQLPRGVPYGGMQPHAGPGPQGYGGRHGRRSDGAVRSAQLDEFRANKSRKWELRVGINSLLPGSTQLYLSRHQCLMNMKADAGRALGHLWVYCGVQRGPARVAFHSAEARVGLRRGDGDRVRRDCAAVRRPAHAGRLRQLCASVSSSLACVDDHVINLLDIVVTGCAEDV